MPAFSGGVSYHSNGGYLRITAGPCRDQLVHVLVAEGMLGRKLKPDEHVHHKDGDVKNPQPTNLLVLGEAIHNAVSNRQYWYLKQKYAREEAAWRAFLDVTGQTYSEWEDESFEPSYLERKEDTSFEPATM
jgi:hypothetical protein